MKVKTKYGDVGVGNTFSGYESCCMKMTEALVTHHQIVIGMGGYVALSPSGNMVSYCPFCGEKVESIYDGKF